MLVVLEDVNGTFWRLLVLTDSTVEQSPMLLSITREEEEEVEEED